MFDAGKTRMIGLPYGVKNYDDMLSRFHLIQERYGQPDRRTDIFSISISRVSTLILNIEQNSCVIVKFNAILGVLMIYAN